MGGRIRGGTFNYALLWLRPTPDSGGLIISLHRLRFIESEGAADNVKFIAVVTSLLNRSILMSACAFRGTTNKCNETSRELNLSGAYREICVLRPDGVVGVVALVRVPVHGGLLGVGEREVRVAEVVVGQGSGHGRMGRMVERVRGEGRRRD